MGYRSYIDHKGIILVQNRSRRGLREDFANLRLASHVDIWVALWQHLGNLLGLIFGAFFDSIFRFVLRSIFDVILEPFWSTLATFWRSKASLKPKRLIKISVVFPWEKHTHTHTFLISEGILLDLKKVFVPIIFFDIDFR